jgi:heme exporter protein C
LNFPLNNIVRVSAVILLLYVHTGGLLFDVPRLNILNETIRALYFHVPMWFGMIFLFLLSVVYAVLHLTRRDGNSSVDSGVLDSKQRTLLESMHYDRMSVEFANVGLLFGILGILSGMLWANYTWGSPWHGDPKQNGAAIALLVYLAYFVLRGSLDNEDQRGRLSAVYNIFAFAAMIPLIFIIPRMSSSVHPGSGGNPGFNMYDLDNRMRMIFYPAVVGWILLGLWIANLRIRLRRAEETIIEMDHE